MKKFFSFFIICSLIFLSISCGKKGSLLPPVIKVPQKIKTFRVYQRGRKIILEWANPEAYTDGSPLTNIRKVEIWLAQIKLHLEKGSKQPNQSEETLKTKVGKKEKLSSNQSSSKEKTISLKEFERQAELTASLSQDKLAEYLIERRKQQPQYRYEYPLTDQDFLSKRYIFALKVVDQKKKSSDYSEFVPIEPKALPLPPLDLRSKVYQDKIEISWTAPEKNINQSTEVEIKGYNVYRYEKGQQPQRLNSKAIESNKYEDKDFVFGKTYYYFVRASVSTTSLAGESADSEVIEVVVQDKFPPSSPSGLIIMAGPGYITLSWDENQDKDLAGYRVWRKKEGEDEFILLTPTPITVNNFTDNKVEKNKRYYYAVTTQDIFGNESQKSEVISEILKEGDP